MNGVAQAFAVRLVAALLALAALAWVARAEASPARQAAVATNTEHVEGMVTSGRHLWVATRGGVERYTLPDFNERRLYTTDHGLAGTYVRSVAIERSPTGAVVVARTQGKACRLRGDRFVCADAAPLPSPEPAVAPRFANARVTGRLRVGSRTVVGTAGAGLWLAKGAGDQARRLTPTDQVCSNHVMTMADYDGRVWLGSFDRGLCTTADGRRFERVAAPFRMVNELEATPHGLFIASSAGLFRTRDGATFERVAAVTERGVNGLAYDGRSLWVTTPGALFRVRLGRRGPRDWNWWMPAGSRSLQAVAVSPDRRVWIATEDRGVIVKTGRRFRAIDRAAGMPSSWVLDVAVGADGVAYAATLRDGVVAIDDRLRRRRVRGLPDKWTLDVHEDPAGLWVGTQGGAALVSAGGASEVVGVPHPNVHGFLRAGGKVFVATEGGLLVVSEPVSVAAASAAAEPL